jgi:hypothetical protein
VTEKAFRLDFWIAIAALLVSVLTSVTLLYQTHVIADQYAATIWPYLTSVETMAPNGLSLQITNNGLGPALLQSAQLFVDTKPVTGWNIYLRALVKDAPTRAYFLARKADFLAGKPMSGSIVTDSIGPGTTIRPGDAITLLKIDTPGIPILTVKQHTIDLKLCYCSLNGSCWNLDTTSAKSPNMTQPVGACASTSSIAPAAFMYPSAPPRKR